MKTLMLLDQIAPGVTRLLVRVGGGPGYRIQRLQLVLTTPVIRAVHFIMQRNQLLGIASPAENARLRLDRYRDPATPQTGCSTGKKGVMSPVQSFVTRRPVLTYFALSFGISWAGGLLVLGPSRIPTTVELLMMIGPITYVAMLAGPSVAGLLMTSLVSGRAGLRELLARLTTWRVGERWYAVALLAPPLMVIAVSLALSFFSPDFLPAIFFASEKPAALSGVVAGLFVGMLVRLFSWLPAFRILMVWVYDRTGSLLVAMLMHGSLTAAQLIFKPPPFITSKMA